MNNNERILALGKKLELRLDKLYIRYKLFPLTEERPYINTLAFVKGLHFKVLRNSAGKHKLILNEE